MGLGHGLRKMFFTIDLIIRTVGRKNNLFLMIEEAWGVVIIKVVGEVLVGAGAQTKDKDVGLSVFKS